MQRAGESICVLRQLHHSSAGACLGCTDSPPPLALTAGWLLSAAELRRVSCRNLVAWGQAPLYALQGGGTQDLLMPA